MQLGLVQVLLHIAGSVWSRLQLGTAIASTAADAADAEPDRARAMQSSHVAMLSSSLGALGILAIDSTAREQIVSSRQSVKLLVDIATTAAGTYRQQVAAVKAGLCLTAADSTSPQPGQDIAAAAPAASTKEGTGLTEQQADMTAASSDTSACGSSPATSAVQLPVDLWELSPQEVRSTAIKRCGVHPQHAQVPAPFLDKKQHHALENILASGQPRWTHHLLVVILDTD